MLLMQQYPNGTKHKQLFNVITQDIPLNNSNSKENEAQNSKIFMVESDKDLINLEEDNKGNKWEMIQNGEKNKVKGRIPIKGLLKDKKKTLDLKSIHSKFFQDNIKRKIKTHFHNFIISFLNQKIKEEWKGEPKYKFRKMESAITQDIRIGTNKILLSTPLKNLLCRMSTKFINRKSNEEFIEIAMEFCPKLREILNMTYQEMFLKYYLNSTHKTFEGAEKDESFQMHLQNMRKNDGLKYMLLFRESSMNFVEFFVKCKGRKTKRYKEHSYHKIPKSRKYKNNKNIIPFKEEDKAKQSICQTDCTSIINQSPSIEDKQQTENIDYDIRPIPKSFPNQQPINCGLPYNFNTFSFETYYNILAKLELNDILCNLYILRNGLSCEKTSNSFNNNHNQ